MQVMQHGSASESAVNLKCAMDFQLHVNMSLMLYSTAIKQACLLLPSCAGHQGLGRGCRSDERGRARQCKHTGRSLGLVSSMWLHRMTEMLFAELQLSVCCWLYCQCWPDPCARRAKVLQFWQCTTPDSRVLAFAACFVVPAADLLT